jgi:hypothetical protein
LFDPKKCLFNASLFCFANIVLGNKQNVIKPNKKFLLTITKFFFNILPFDLYTLRIYLYIKTKSKNNRFLIMKVKFF